MTPRRDRTPQPTWTNVDQVDWSSRLHMYSAFTATAWSRINTPLLYVTLRRPFF